MPDYVFCNGRSDCADGSDEWGCDTGYNYGQQRRSSDNAALCLRDALYRAVSQRVSISCCRRVHSR